MTSDLICEFGATSAAGAMLRRRANEPLPVGRLLNEMGTSTAYPTSALIVRQAVRTSQTTTTGPSVASTSNPGTAIAELRRLSGFTWEQLSRLFSVSRRSLHFWASGKAMAPSNEEHLQRLVSTLRKVDRGAASANRAALLSACSDGSLPFDLLTAGDYDRVISLLGPGESRPALRPRVSPEARTGRAPRPPAERVDALQDRIHRDAGAGRAARTARVRSDR
jgi:DNA-binding transcriptional regulator YiaG